MKLMQSTCVVALFIAAGCTPSTPTANSTPTGSTASHQAMQNAMGVTLDPTATVGGSTSTPAPAPAPTPLSPPPVAPPAQPASEQVKAEAGVGIKGQSLREHSGVLVEPAKAYFSVQQRLTFDQVLQAMQLFQASEGRKPNSEQEFMTKVIAANNIQLPKLPQGHKYVYNVEQGELMVEKPAQ